MDTKKLEIFSLLKFQDKIIINGKTLYRGNSPRELSTQDKIRYWEYELYSEWDKTKNLLPKPNHLVKIYVSFKEKERGSFEVDRYIKGILKNLQTNTEEKITSISYPLSH